MADNRSTWALTVAAIVERDGRYLMVEETDGWNPERVLNQPAGHVDPGEYILDAVVRETLEETGLEVELGEIVGLYSRLAAEVVTVAFEARIVGGEATVTRESLETRPFAPSEIPCAPT